MAYRECVLVILHPDGKIACESWRNDDLDMREPPRIILNSIVNGPTERLKIILDRRIRPICYHRDGANSGLQINETASRIMNNPLNSNRSSHVNVYGPFIICYPRGKHPPPYIHGIGDIPGGRIDLFD